MIDEKAFDMMKKGVRVFNCARGGIIKETALVEALKSGKVAAAGLDVYESEPLAKDSPLRDFPNLVLTPHLGASTKEAQESCGIEVAEVIADALETGAIRNAINKPSIDAESMKKISPYIVLCEKLGLFVQQISPERVEKITIKYFGKLGDIDNKILTLAVQKGYLSKIVENANDVNAPAKIKHLGIGVESINSNAEVDYAEFVEVIANCENGKIHSAAGTVTGKSARPRIVQISGNQMELNPNCKCAVIIKNQDTPGMVGQIGTVLGEYGCNIANMALAREDGTGKALSVFELDSIPETSAVEEIKSIVETVKIVDFS
jgi:D-3-phosphoglycerate dehydrogenase